MSLQATIKQQQKQNQQYQEQQQQQPILRDLQIKNYLSKRYFYKLDHLFILKFIFTVISTILLASIVSITEKTTNNNLKQLDHFILLLQTISIFILSVIILHRYLIDYNNKDKKKKIIFDSTLLIILQLTATFSATRFLKHLLAKQKKTDSLLSFFVISHVLLLPLVWV